MIPFAEELFLRTDGKVPTGPGHFVEVWGIAERMEL